MSKLSSVPIVKTGLSLMTNTVVTALLGLIFWIVAARIFTEEQVGVSNTVIITMMYLADLSCLGLRTGVARFLPSAGDRRVGLLLPAYGLPVVVAAAAAAVYLVGLKLWAPELAEFRLSSSLPLLFVVCTAFWSTFMLQDSVLVALRRGPWIPTENALFGIIKIVLLFVFVDVSSDYGIYLAWALPIVPIVLVTNLFISKVLRGGSSAGDEEVAIPGAGSPFEPTVGKLFRFSFRDWFSSVARLIPLLVIPYLVLNQSGKAEAGFYQIAWGIAFALFALGTGVAEAVVAETSYDLDSLEHNVRRAGMLALAVTVPAVIIGLLAAPYLARIYGPSYEENSTHLIRILVPASIPNIFLQLFISRLRSIGRMRLVIFAEAIIACLVLGLALFLGPRFGVTGVAWAWLGAFSGAAVIAVGLYLSGHAPGLKQSISEASDVDDIVGISQ